MVVAVCLWSDAVGPLLVGAPPGVTTPLFPLLPDGLAGDGCHRSLLLRTRSLGRPRRPTGPGHIASRFATAFTCSTPGSADLDSPRFQSRSPIGLAPGKYRPFMGAFLHTDSDDGNPK